MKIDTPSVLSALSQYGQSLANAQSSILLKEVDLPHDARGLDIVDQSKLSIFSGDYWRLLTGIGSSSFKLQAIREIVQEALANTTQVRDDTSIGLQALSMKIDRHNEHVYEYNDRVHEVASLFHLSFIDSFKKEPINNFHLKISVALPSPKPARVAKTASAPSSKGVSFRGIENSSGRHCFCNTFLSMFAASAKFLALLQKRAKEGNELSQALLALFNELYSYGDTEALSHDSDVFKRFLEVLEEKAPLAKAMYDEHRQQDLPEFCHAILDELLPEDQKLLYNSITKPGKAAPYSLLPSGKKRTPIARNMPLYKLLTGLVNKALGKEEKYTTVKVPLSLDKEYDIEDFMSALEKGVNSEEDAEAGIWYQKLASKEDFDSKKAKPLWKKHERNEIVHIPVKKSVVFSGEAPDVMPVQVCRFSQKNDGTYQKIHNKVSCPFEFKAKFGDKTVTYRLRSIGIHAGDSLEHGHYYSYAIEKKDGAFQGIEHNDTYVLDAKKWEEIPDFVKENCYMFIYERVDA